MREGVIKTRPAFDRTGHPFSAAVCSQCDRDASETSVSRYCIHAVDGTPLLCDDCTERLARKETGNAP